MYEMSDLTLFMIHSMRSSSTSLSTAEHSNSSIIRVGYFGARGSLQFLIDNFDDGTE